MLATLILMWFLLGIFSISFSIVFAVLYLFTAIGVPTLTYLLTKRIGNKTVNLNSKLSNLSVDIVNGISELSLYGRKREFTEEFNKVQTQLLREEKKMNRIQGLNDSLIGLMMNLTVWITLITAIPEVTSGSIEGVSLSIIVIGIMASFEALLPIPAAVQYLEETTEAGNRLFEITEMSKSKKSEETTDLMPKSADIEFDNVIFSYTEETNVLNCISFKLPETGFTALVGATGSGKSTLINLITKLWNADSGRIKIGGIDISQIDDERLRQMISVVPQKIDLFTGTIRENLLVGNPNADETKMYDALKIAELSNFVESLPNKLDTGIGELGKTLSGGERKRLALARALLKDSSILILDEINAGLDSPTERKILDNLQSLSKRKNILLITHRLLGMERLGEILVLRDGRIIDKGRHSELINKDGLYKSMYKSQHQLV
jgi:ATP-binding cassette subfamily C protein CydC